MRISDWSSDVCSSDLRPLRRHRLRGDRNVVPAADQPVDPADADALHGRELCRRLLPAVDHPHDHAHRHRLRDLERARHRALLAGRALRAQADHRPPGGPRPRADRGPRHRGELPLRQRAALKAPVRCDSRADPTTPRHPAATSTQTTGATPSPLTTMPLGIAYAIWSGLGILLISLFGLFVFKQTLDLPAVIGLVLIVAGVIVVNVFSDSVRH